MFSGLLLQNHQHSTCCFWSTYRQPGFWILAVFQKSSVCRGAVLMSGHRTWLLLDRPYAPCSEDSPYRFPRRTFFFLTYLGMVKRSHFSCLDSRSCTRVAGSAWDCGWSPGTCNKHALRLSIASGGHIGLSEETRIIRSLPRSPTDVSSFLRVRAEERVLLVTVLWKFFHQLILGTVQNRSYNVWEGCVSPRSNTPHCAWLQWF